MPFLDSLDIANRAVQMLGGEQIASPTEDSSRQVELTFAYDKLKRPELQRNVWTFAVRKAVLRAIGTGTMFLVPSAWNAGTTYQPGSIVADTNNVYWITTQEQNINNAPGGNNTAWTPYYGPLTITPYNQTYSGATVWSSGTTYAIGVYVLYGGAVYASLASGNLNNNPSTATAWWSVVVPSTAYYAGELVYVPGSGSGTGPTFNGGYQIYLSLINQNGDSPPTPTPWNASTVYYGGQQVQYSGTFYTSVIEYNVGNTPQASVAAWSATTAYTTGQQVTGSNNFIYQALSNNSGNDPTTDGGVHWQPLNIPNAWTVSTANPSDINWLAINASMKNLILVYPIGSGPSSETFTKNVFHLPANYLRMAPQDPKAGSVSILGAPTGDIYEDWAFENSYIVSEDIGPIVLRFVADIVNVKEMHDLFCEGLANRMAYECCEKLTQSDAKKVQLGQAYNKFMTDARTVNAIETGADEPPMDDWISTRL